MKNVLPVFLVFVSALFAQSAAQFAVPQDLQALPDGFYYSSSQGLRTLEQIPLAGGGAKHIGKMFVPGLTPQMVWTFRGASAREQIADRRPTFYVKEQAALATIAGRSERDLVIVRLDAKKDHRELQWTSGSTMFTFKSGFSRERLPEIITKTISEGTFMVTPTEDLKPGEYIVTFSSLGNSGYDFAITPVRH